jgi:molecular chaperone GrpE
MAEEINWQKLYDVLSERYEHIENTMKEMRESIDKRIKDAEHRTRESLYARLISMYDAMELLSKAAISGNDIDALRKAIALVFRNYLNLFAAEDISIVDSAPGAVFNPLFHEAVLMTADNDIPEGHIINEDSKGFCQGGKLLRPARVVVSSGKEEKK